MQRVKMLSIVFLFSLLVSCSANKELQQLSSTQQKEIELLKLENENLRSRLENKDVEVDQIMAQLKDIQEVSIRGNRVVLPNAILFSSGSVVVKESGQKVLDALWDVLVAYPDREILIEGHTDNEPIAEKFQGKYKTNWELSSTRALRVLHYVSKHANANPGRLGAVGYGEFRPVADNKTEEGRLLNRRVEIVIGRQLK